MEDFSFESIKNIHSVSDVLLLLASNPFIQTLLLGALLASLRKVPSSIYTYLKKNLVPTLFVESDTSSNTYNIFLVWLTAYSKSIGAGEFRAGRNKTLSTYNANYPTLLGTSYTFWKRRLIIFNSYIDKVENSKGNKYVGEITVYMFLGTKDLMKEFYSNVMEEGHKLFIPEDTVVINKQSMYGVEEAFLPKRNVDTFYLSIANEILEDARNFLTSKELYNYLGIPWKRGYLFYGEPGTGKTRMAHILAGELNLPLFIAQSKNSLSEIEQREGIFLIEDIDCGDITTNREEDSIRSTTNLSELLNFLDGVVYTEGSITIITTNDISKLDPALLRPGRCDRKFHFTRLEEKDALKMATKFGLEKEYKDIIGRTPAEAQIYLLKKLGISE